VSRDQPLPRAPASRDAAVTLADLLRGDDQYAESAAVLTGHPLTPESIEQAAELAAQAARPRTDHRGSAAYKRHMVRTFALRLLSRNDAPAQEKAERAA